MNVTITVHGTKYKLPPIKMKLWREIQKIKSAKLRSCAELAKQNEKLASVLDETAFNLLAAQIELDLALDIETERQQMADLIAGAFEYKFSAPELIAEIGIDTVPVVFQALEVITMRLLSEKGAEMPETQKKSDVNFADMTEYQQVMHLYGLLHRQMRWSRAQIDDEEIEYVFDLFIAQAIGNEETLVPIDQIL